MRLFLKLLPFLFLYSCATQYMLPSNRFITPETQGGVMKGQFEFTKSKASKLTVDDTTSDPVNGVDYSDLSRTGFVFSTSVLEQVDFVWTNTAGPSLLGLKVQAFGGSKSSKSTDHKLGFMAAMGGNEHSDKKRVMDFELYGNEFLVSYGYRFSEYVLPYTSISYANYDFEGKFFKGNLAGDEAKFSSNVMGTSIGVDTTFGAFSAKLESTYQTIKTTATNLKSRFVTGFSLGLSW